MNSAAAPIVSVCIITYNHAPHIRKAIDSALAQVTTFPFEILIGEDSSTDGTTGIVFEYQRAHPDLISVYQHKRSDVVYVNGSPTGRWNSFDTMNHARGKYIAFIEGDDYWTDPYKLQKQYDALELDPSASLCGHWTRIVDQSGDEVNDQPIMAIHLPRIFTAQHAISSTPIHPNTFLFRNFKLKEHSKYPLLLRLPSADDPISLILLGLGHGLCLPEIMSAYRIHPGGTWSQKSELRQTFEMLQYQMNVPLLAPRRLIPLAVYKTSYLILRFTAKLLKILVSNNKEPLSQLRRVIKHQTAIGLTHLIFWIPATIILTPVHIVAFLTRKIRRFVQTHI